MAVLGAICFGLVIGWITYGALRRRQSGAPLTDLAAVLASVLAPVGGGLVVALLDAPEVFGGYAVGLAVGFFGYLVLVALLPDSKWTGESPGRPVSTNAAQSSGSVEP
ncbi:hypothetical protein GCM10022224_086300 [Nonomuraea antimicrobica]|uniref:Major facilitator superfamily (MFS) profile domain-containing protein n=1 Tax=Nonomuraea antimicrobica TaxID=561173 RepID=A0ABP7DP67_9ACTN